jgi:hypothetical protein
MMINVNVVTNGFSFNQIDKKPTNQIFHIIIFDYQCLDTH